MQNCNNSVKDFVLIVLFMLFFDSITEFKSVVSLIQITGIDTILTSGTVSKYSI